LKKTFSQYISLLNESNSRLYKEATLKEIVVEDSNFLQLLKMTYSPEYVYGIKKVEMPSTFGHHNLSEQWGLVGALLYSLTSRSKTGNSARDDITTFLSTILEEEAIVFCNLLKGDLRCNVSTSSINNVFPGTIPEYPYMRCSLMKGSNVDSFDWSKGIYSQEKADGMFANIEFKTRDDIKITSRNGTLFHNGEFKNFLEDFMKVAVSGNLYNGELLVIRAGNPLPREIGNGILNSVLKGGSFENGDVPLYMVWDVIPLDVVVAGVHDEVYSSRFERVKRLSSILIKPIETKIVYSLEEAYEHYTSLTLCGLEGTVIKNPVGIWKDGTSKDQIKLKVEAEVDLVVKGTNPGNGKNEKYFGSLICESSDGNVQVNVSGFKDEMRKEIHENIEDWVGKIITVRANSLMKSTKQGEPNRLFLPRFVEKRLDKTEADTIEKIEQIFKEALGN
jgi:DNA ligase 1